VTVSAEWPIVELGLGLSVRHGFAFKGEFFRDSGDLIVLTPGNFHEGGGFKLKSKEKFYDGPVPDGSLLRRGDVVVAMTEQSKGLLGSTATVPADETFLHNQRLGLLQVADPGLLDLRYCYHLLNSPEARNQIQATATGSKVRHTAPERIQAIRIPLPDVEYQVKVAGALDSVEASIRNNRRRIEVLEEMARLIYREWFVHFRFAGHEDVELVDSELGPVPEGWEYETLADAAHLVMGQSPKSEFYNDDGVGLPFHQGVTNFGTRYPEHKKWCTQENRIAEEGDVLLSVRAPVGRINVAPDRLVIGRGLAALRSRRDMQVFLFEALREVFTEEDAMGGGTIFNAVTKKDLKRIGLVRPPESVVEHFERNASAMFDLVGNLTRQNRVLAEARDLLLPRLISGELDVADLDLDLDLDLEPVA
jgi:type I restriction enzyme S subunit